MDLVAFVGEADRVLTAAGVIVVSNYSFGRPATGTATDLPERFADRVAAACRRVRDAAPSRRRPSAPCPTNGSWCDADDARRLPRLRMTDTAWRGPSPERCRPTRSGRGVTRRFSGFGAEQSIDFDASLLVLTPLIARVGAPSHRVAGASSGRRGPRRRAQVVAVGADGSAVDLGVARRPVGAEEVVEVEQADAVGMRGGERPVDAVELSGMANGASRS